MNKILNCNRSNEIKVFRNTSFWQCLYSVQSGSKCKSVNESPDIKMYILPTVLHNFVMELVRRICLNIKTSYPW